MGCGEGVSDWSGEVTGKELELVSISATDETYSISILLAEAEEMAFPLQSNIRTQRKTNMFKLKKLILYDTSILLSS